MTATATGAMAGLVLGSLLPVALGRVAVGVSGLGLALAVALGARRPAFVSWRVPRRALFFGRREGVAVVFGFALASVLLTEVASVGIYFLVLWDVTIASPAQATLVMGVFGLTRMIPTLAEAVMSHRTCRSPDGVTVWLRLAPRLRMPEAGLLLIVSLALVQPR
jgi:hypothetical protein